MPTKVCKQCQREFTDNSEIIMAPYLLPGEDQLKEYHQVSSIISKGSVRLCGPIEEKDPT